MPNPPPHPGRYLTAAEAAAALNVSTATLYAYVSRGLIRSEAEGAGTRRRRYLAEDVQRLQARQEQRRHPEQAVTRALDWGTPILDSALTLITGGRFYYRGHDALRLAQTATVEQVAALLWTGRLEAPGLFAEPSPLPRRVRALLPHLAGLAPIEQFQSVLPAAAAEDVAALDLRPAAAAQTGARIMQLLAQVAASAPQGRSPRRLAGSDDGLAAGLAQAWAPSVPAAPTLISQALILCADHELNVSSFTARCAASAGATLYGVVSAGLAALQGFRHGGHTERVEALLAEIGSPRGVRAALARRLRLGEGVPGFGHRLYPEGDPRGAALLSAAAAARPRAAAVRLARAVAREVEALTGERPTVDFGLAVVAAALGLPRGSALALFALGRTIGWVAHAIEQYEAGRLIRPRARYVGVGVEVGGQEIEVRSRRSEVGGGKQ